MMFVLARAYASVYGYATRRLGVHLPGLGAVLRLVRSDRMISVMGVKMYFNHRVAGAYAAPITGRWNEPETHLFLNSVISSIGEAIAFIDVGANVGEIVLDVARHSNVKQITAFEPILDCCHAIRQSAAASGIRTIRVVQTLVGEGQGSVGFVADAKNPHVSSIYSSGSTGSDGAAIRVPVTTLDNEITRMADHLIILIDVEGYEPLVLQGGAALIRSKLPLIIFEYNEVSKRHYTSSDIRRILGSAYDIHRLRRDGRLDGDVERAWNCVAVPRRSPFSAVVGQMIV